MANEPDNTPAPEDQEGISEDDLRKLIGEELDSRLSSITTTLEGLGDSIFDKLKGSGTDEDTLLGKIGEMIDKKLKTTSGGSNANHEPKQPREPKLRIFG